MRQTPLSMDHLLHRTSALNAYQECKYSMDRGAWGGTPSPTRSPRSRIQYSHSPRVRSGTSSVRCSLEQVLPSRPGRNSEASPSNSLCHVVPQNPDRVPSGCGRALCFQRATASVLAAGVLYHTTSVPTTYKQSPGLEHRDGYFCSRSAEWRIRLQVLSTYSVGS